MHMAEHHVRETGNPLRVNVAANLIAKLGRNKPGILGIANQIRSGARKEKDKWRVGGRACNEIWYLPLEESRPAVPDETWMRQGQTNREAAEENSNE